MIDTMTPNHKNLQASITVGKVQFTIVLLECCAKKYKKLSKKDNVLKKCTENYLEELKTNPYIGDKLEINFPGLRSIHYLGNKYRIIYKIIYEPVPTIVICEINHRKASYTDLAKTLRQGK